MVVFIFPETVTIKDSYKVVRPRDIMKELKYIYYQDHFPKVIRERGLLSLFIEWVAHNFLYYLSYERDRTASVDFDNEPLKNRVQYTALAFVYCIGVWKLIELTNKRK